MPVVASPARSLRLPTGKYIENHGVVHNMFYNTSSKLKLPYHATLGIQRWWDNGSVPIWITAQRQVTPSPRPSRAGHGPGEAQAPAQKGGQCGPLGRAPGSRGICRGLPSPAPCPPEPGTQRGGSILPVRQEATLGTLWHLGRGSHGKRTPRDTKGCDHKTALSPPPPAPLAGWAARPQGRGKINGAVVSAQEPHHPKMSWGFLALGV